jgi:hypothetical protein
VAGAAAGFGLQVSGSGRRQRHTPPAALLRARRGNADYPGTRQRRWSRPRESQPPARRRGDRSGTRGQRLRAPPRPPRRRPVLLADAGGCDRLDGIRIGESIPPDTALLLAELGLLPGFLAQGHERCLGSCSSWGDDALGYNDFVTNPHGPGWHLDRNRFDTFLAHQAAGRGARLELGWRLETAERRPAGGWRLTFHTPRGRTQTVDAVVAVTTDPASCRRRTLRNPVSWLCHLAQTRHIGARLDGSAFLPERLRAWPATSSRLDPPHGDDWLAVGDPAGAYDPLTSQGIYKALSGGLQAGDAIARRLAGETADFTAYGESLARSWKEYLRLRTHLYTREARWPDQPFWQARREKAAA